jgi:hypothetical protein
MENDPKTAQGKSWRDVLKVHPAAELFPLMSPDELKVLGEDIKKNGLTNPVKFWTDRLEAIAKATKGEKITAEIIANYMFVLDGRNRLDAMEAVGMPVLDLILLPHVTGLCIDDPYHYVVSTNVHRRHLTAEQKREIIARVLKAKPEASDRQIAKGAKVDHKTVGAVREKLEARGEIPHVETVTDTKGRKQSSKRRHFHDSTESVAVLAECVTGTLPTPAKAPPSSEPKRKGPNPILRAWWAATDEERRGFVETVGNDIERVRMELQRIAGEQRTKEIGDRAEARSKAGGAA